MNLLPPNDHLARDVFVGRERELEVLRASLEETIAGQGRAVVLLGEPGIGKTRLTSEIIPYAQDQDMRVLIGRCPDSDGAPPYWPWVQIVRAYIGECDAQRLRTEMGAGAAELAHVIPVVREQFPDLVPALAPPPRLEPEHERFRFFDSLTTFLKNAAHRQPLLLIFDDLQWADAPSLLFLQFLVRELTDTKLLLILTCREHEAIQRPQVSQTLAAIARTAGSQTLSLRGLTDGEVGQFITLTTGHAPSTEIGMAVFQRTEGHPFFLTEVVRLLASEQATTMPGTSHTLLPVLPHTVRSVIEQRLATVSMQCRQVLTRAAVIGREFRLRVLEAVAGQRESRVRNAASLVEERRRESSESVLSVLALLDEALAARLVAPTPQNVGHYSFTHALIQETLYEGIATTERLSLHRRIGESLEVLAGDYVAPFLPELAHHFFQAALAGSGVDKAIAYATSAAEMATTMLAYEEATAQYERALQMLSFKEPDDELRCELLLALGKAQNRASDFAAAQQHFQKAADLARTRKFSNQFAHAALELAGTRIPVSGANPAILYILHEALALLPKDAYALRAQLLARLAKELTYSDSHEQREQCSSEAVTLARRTTDPYALGAALCDHCTATWRPDSLPERLAMSVEISALAAQVGDPELILYSHFLHIANALEHDDALKIDVEIAGFARQVAEIRPPRYPWLWFQERLQTMRAILTGRFAEAERQLLASSSVLLQTPSRRDAEPMLFPQLLVLHREQGRLQDLGLEAMLKPAVEQYPAVSALRCALAYVRSELGREVEARIEFEYWAERGFATVPQRQDRLVALSYLAEMCTTWGDTPRAKQLYDLLLPYAERNVVIGMAIGYLDNVAHLLGKLATVLGRYGDAQAHFEFSLQRNLHLGAHPRLAHTQYSYARMLLTRSHAGDQERAATLLGQALAIAQELGMRGLEDKVKSQRAKGKRQKLEPKVQGSTFEVQGKISLESSVQSLASTSQLVSTPSTFRREGDYWTVTYQDTVLRLKDTTGLRYLAQLLRYPTQEFHVLDLLGNDPERRADPRTATPDLTSSGLGDAGEVLDPQARTAYKRRLEDLRDELAEAQGFNDAARIERLEQEMEFLTHELTRAYGLGGRQRKAASAAQRARVNVTLSIKNVLKKINKQHPPLALYLSTTIKTGTFCSYTPDQRLPVTWEF